MFFLVSIFMWALLSMGPGCPRGVGGDIVKPPPQVLQPEALGPSSVDLTEIKAPVPGNQLSPSHAYMFFLPLISLLMFGSSLYFYLFFTRRVFFFLYTIESKYANKWKLRKASPLRKTNPPFQGL